MDSCQLLNEGLKVAQTYDVSSKEDSVVVYSISFQNNSLNRDKAFDFITKNPDKMLIEHTECGSKLVEMGFESVISLDHEDVMMIWAEASRRFIASAKGNITAFVDNAHPQSTFRSVELPNILKNENIKTINGLDKYKFADRFKQ